MTSTLIRGHGFEKSVKNAVVVNSLEGMLSRGRALPPFLVITQKMFDWSV
jgi:hypothetical protein